MGFLSYTQGKWIQRPHLTRPEQITRSRCSLGSVPLRGRLLMENPSNRLRWAIKRHVWLSADIPFKVRYKRSGLSQRDIMNHYH
ncbi:MAG: hypothetical protein LBQ54_12560 [Planctomycetaceae bacterium]|nr:hypothetical protein [Planctomycetaceae bacterium]